MGLAPAVIGKGVKDSKCRWVHADGEPGDRLRFLLHQRQPAFKEAFNLFFLARLGLQPNPQCHTHICHNASSDDGIWMQTSVSALCTAHIAEVRRWPPR